MANSAVSSVYRFVIDDVITNVRREFEDMGVDETIMHDLQRSWEAKIAQSRVTPNFQASDATAATSTSTNATDASYAGYDDSHATATTTFDSTTAPTTTTGRPYVPPKANVGPAATTATTATSGNIPQTDGASDMGETHQMMSTAEMDAYVERRFQEAREAEAFGNLAPGEVSFTLTLVDRETRRAKMAELGSTSSQATSSLSPSGAAIVAKTIAQMDGDVNNDEDDTGLGSDLDDSDGDMDEESDNIVLCQYDKVTRSKSKWKCVLKDGIMLINGRDYLFHKANGDFEW